MTTQTAAAPLPGVRTITASDIKDALRAGVGDMAGASGYSLVFGVVFSALGMLIWFLLVYQGSSYWALPLAAGFPLIGPFAAVGLYEISRRRENGEDLSWGIVLGAVVRGGSLQVPSYAFIVLFVFMVWVYLAHLVFALSFGLKPLTNVMTSFDLLFSGPGITMLVIGTIVGGAIATFLFVISVVSVPLLMDRDIDVVTAMITSVRAVAASPQPMLIWGLTIAGICVLAMLPFFLGMVIAFPILGHASWHMFRKTVESA